MRGINENNLMLTFINIMQAWENGGPDELLDQALELKEIIEKDEDYEN